MKVTDRTRINLEFSDLAKRINHPEPQRTRSSGVHLSGVLKYIALELGLLDSKQGQARVDKEDVEEMPMRMMLGMAAEREIVGYYPNAIWQPQALTLDGITGSPDMFGHDRDDVYGDLESWVRVGVIPFVDEFKCTYKSMRERHDNIEREWMWQSQVMGYTKMLQEEIKRIIKRLKLKVVDPLPTIGRLHVLWINGAYDYKGDVPVYIRYTMQYSQEELDKNWALILKYKDKATPEQH